MTKLCVAILRIRKLPILIVYETLARTQYSRHKKFINDYLMYFGGSKSEFKRDT